MSEFYPFKLHDKVVGYLRKDGLVYVTKRNSSTFFHKYKGFAISKEAIDILKLKGVVKLRIKYEGTRLEHWDVGIQYFIDNAHIYDFNGDVQYVLSKEHWHITDEAGNEIQSRLGEFVEREMKL